MMPIWPANPVSMPAYLYVFIKLTLFVKEHEITNFYSVAYILASLFATLREMLPSQDTCINTQSNGFVQI